MKPLRFVSLGLVLAIGAIVFVAGNLASTAQSAVPAMITFQGRLLDSSDHPVTGSLTLILSIYDSPTGGVQLWTETHTAVTVTSGLFSLDLGSIVPLSADVLAGSALGPSTRYVQIQVSGQAALSPRTPLLASAYSLESSRLSGDVQSAPGSVTYNDGSHDRWKLVSSQGSVTYVGTWDVSNHSSSLLYSDTDSGGVSLRLDDRDLIGLRAGHNTANIECDVDANGNGHAERSAWQKVDNTVVTSLVAVDVDDDGVTDVGSETSARVAGTILKSFFQTGDFPTQSQFVAHTDSAGAGTLVTADVNHNGSPDIGSSMEALESRSVLKTFFQTGDFPTQRQFEAHSDSAGAMAMVTADVDNNGVPDVGTSMDAEQTRSELKTYFETGDVPTEGRSHITHTVDADGATTGMETRLNGLPPGEVVTGTLTMSTGVTKSDVSLGNVTDESHIQMTSSSGPFPGGAPSSTFRMGRPAINEATWIVDGGGASQNTKSGGLNVGLYVSNLSGQCKMAMVDGTLGTEDTSIVIDGKTKRFGIGVSEPDYPIQHSSGARLTAAGDWENASDVNLKENFAKVEGKQLLKEIDKLPISRWNYKADAEDVTHIGPTAQDFKDVFGVGGSDKTISTIDPSGIALAAIQELNRQNQQLQEKNDHLQKQLDELSRKVEKLTAGK